MPAISIRPAARRDLTAHYVYLVENASMDIADRFFENTQSTFTMLAQQPLIGAPLTLSRKELDGLRKWRIREFEKFLIFYFPRRDGVSIVRVLHAAQDWWGSLGME